MLVIFQPLFWFWPFCCFQTKNIPWYKCPRLVRGSQDKVSPVCPTDPRRFLSFLRVTMEGTAFSDHHYCPVSAQQLSLPRTPQALHCHRVFLFPDRVSHNCALFVVLRIAGVQHQGGSPRSLVQRSFALLWNLASVCSSLPRNIHFESAKFAFHLNIFEGSRDRLEI